MSVSLLNDLIEKKNIYVRHKYRHSLCITRVEGLFQVQKGPLKCNRRQEATENESKIHSCIIIYISASD